MTQRPRWTNDEIAILRKMYADGSLNYDLLPTHTRDAIKHKASALGLANSPLPGARQSWTPEDSAMLCAAYDGWPVAFPVELLARHNSQSCWTQATRLGLTRRRNVGSTFDHITEPQWAYLAGIIDGEGTIHTDRPLVDWALATFPESTVGTRLRGGKWKDCYQVRWSRSAVLAEMIPRLLPYLIVKREKAEKLLAELPEGYV